MGSEKLYRMGLDVVLNRGVKSACLDENGHLIFVMSDNQEVDLGDLKGPILEWTAAYLEENGLKLDTTLTLAGCAADAKAVGDALKGKVSVAGDTMTGSLNMSGQSVRNVAAPVNGADAVNKDYVDTLLDACMADLEETVRLYGSGNNAIARIPITIPAAGWEEDASAPGYGYVLNLAVSGVKSGMASAIVLYPESLAVASACGLSTACETCSGAVRIWASSAPPENLPADLLLTGINGISEEITLPATGWIADSSVDGYAFRLDYSLSDAVSDSIPALVVHPGSLSAAAACALASACETCNGGIRFWAGTVPEEPVSATLLLTGLSGILNIGAGSGAGGYNVATEAEVAEMLEGVFTEDGSRIAADSEVAEMLTETFGNAQL